MPRDGVANMMGSLNQFVLVKARKSRGDDWWSPDDYDVREFPSFIEPVNVMPKLLRVEGRVAKAFMRFRFWNCKDSRRTCVSPILAAWYCVLTGAALKAPGET